MMHATSPAAPSYGQSPQKAGRRCIRDSSQTGQALIEFLVLALAVIPLFLLIPVIAKYQDIAHAAQLASRYVAFEATARNDSVKSWKSPGQLSDEVRRRFFGNSDAPIKTGDTAGNFNANRNPFWTDQRGAPLIRDFDSDVIISFGEQRSADHSGAFAAASDGLPFGVPPVNVRDAMGLQVQGIYTANISVSLANLTSASDSYTKSYDQFGKIDLAMKRSTSLLVDSWTAADPDQIETRIGSIALFPGTMLAPAAELVNLAVEIVESPSCFKGECTKEKSVGKLGFWSDVVPTDRLK